MGPYDIMYVKISSVKFADLYIAKGKKLVWFDHLDQSVTDGQIFGTKAGWQFYVVGVSNTIFAGTFKM
jgi:hypothetical protein